MIQMILYCSRIVSQRSVDAGTQRSVDAGTQCSKKAEPTCHVQRRIQILSDCSCIISERSKKAEPTCHVQRRIQILSDCTDRADSEPPTSLLSQRDSRAAKQAPGSDPA